MMTPVAIISGFAPDGRREGRGGARQGEELKAASASGLEPGGASYETLAANLSGSVIRVSSILNLLTCTNSMMREKRGVS